MAYNLIRPNNEELFCKNLYTDNIILPNDTGGLVSVGCAIYSRTGTAPNYTYTSLRSGITLYYAVHKNIMLMFMRSSTGNFTVSGGPYTRLFLGPFDNTPPNPQPILWHTPYKIESADGEMCYSIPMLVINDVTVTLRINSDVGGVDGDTIIELFPTGTTTTPGSFPNTTTGPPQTYYNLCNFVLALPVQYVG